MRKTTLDDSLELALKEPKQGGLFYDTLLNVDLLFPVQIEGKTEGDWTQVSLSEKFHPLFLKFEKGTPIPCFDTLEKLQNWAEDKPLDYAQIKGFQVLSVIGKEVSILLNPGTLYNYVLTSEILEKLRIAMQPVSPI